MTLLEAKEGKETSEEDRISSFCQQTRIASLHKKDQEMVHGGLWGHTYNTLGKRSPLESGEAQVTDLHGSGRPSDEDVVTLEVTVDNGR